MLKFSFKYLFNIQTTEIQPETASKIIEPISCLMSVETQLLNLIFFEDIYCFIYWLNTPVVVSAPELYTKIMLIYCLQVCLFLLSLGYELTFISAPRSLQGTAMGMFYLLEGLGQTLFMGVASTVLSFANNSTSKWIFGCIGVGGNAVGILLLVLAEKTIGLGLNKTWFCVGVCSCLWSVLKNNKKSRFAHGKCLQVPHYAIPPHIWLLEFTFPVFICNAVF